MKLTKATICSLIILLQLCYTVSAMDSYYSLENSMILPKNSNDLSIKTHWQYIGYYLYKLLYGNDYFSEAAKAKIDKIFGDNQSIISQLDFLEDKPSEDLIYALNLSGVSFDNEEDLVEENEEDTDLNESEGEEKQEGEENEEGKDSTQEVNTEEASTDAPQSEENASGEPAVDETTQQVTEVPSDGSQLPITDGNTSGEVPLYGQMGVQNATLPAGYNSMSDPNIMMQQQGGALGGYNIGYGANNNGPMYYNNNQNLEGQPMYDGQTYNAGMGNTNNYGGMNNSYNNMSDFQQNNQNMGMYQQQQQGMSQQQDGSQNPYNQMNGMSDNQYNQGGMPQGNEEMSQYGQQQMQPYDSSQQQQQIHRVNPSDYQDQGDMTSQSYGDMQMQQQQDQMQAFVEDGMEEQQFSSQTEQSDGQFVGEEQSRADDIENGETENRFETQSTDENAEVSNKIREQDTMQQRFEEETDTNETEQQQMFSSPEASTQNSNRNETSIVENQPQFTTGTTNSQQESAIQMANAPSSSSQLQNAAQENAGISAQISQQRQALPYTTSQSGTSTPWTSEVDAKQQSFVDGIDNTNRNSVFDGAEWNPQRGSSTWESTGNEAPLHFDPNAPLTSKDF